MCLGCIEADHPMVDRIYDQNETAIDNYLGCNKCSWKELATHHYQDIHESIPDPSNSKATIHRRHVSFKRKIASRSHSRAAKLLLFWAVVDICVSCGHVVAEHQFSIVIQNKSRESDMTCSLCGTYEDVVSETDDVREEILTR